MATYDRFTTKADLTVMFPRSGKWADADIDFPNSIEISFELDVIYRSWGIADVVFIFPPSISIPYEVEQSVDGPRETLELEVPLENVEQTRVEGDGITVDGLVVDLDDDFKVKSVEAYISGLFGG